MSRHALRPRKDICQLCDFALVRQSLFRPPFRTRKPINTPRLLSSSTRLAYPSKSQTTTSTPIERSPNPNSTARSTTTELDHRTLEELGHILQEVKSICNSLLSTKGIPSEQETIQTLGKCQALAKILAHESSLPSLGSKGRASSALLSIDDSARTKSSTTRPQTLQSLQDELSEYAYKIMLHPPMFITPEALKLYVDTQSTLERPETLPEILQLYASKPLPEEGSSPLRYVEQNPDKVSNAITKSVADQALQAAIDAKQLIPAMDIIESSYSTTAFRRAKFVRKGLLPTTGLAIAPLAAYTLASQLASLQTTMETGMATNVAFAGMLAYVGFTATIGVVAVTTANDQMDRVTWAPGLPLRERWAREEERAAIDKVAGAWGFREVWRRGEEEGEEWDALREWIGLKGMILDRTELMEGME
ncbi:hypothetical protein BGZ60DRAFT_380239 [Tricladium varicosporioides]|nr:hypothetical protein BGZ60DRAFT_380239 [Hymenoscyphus varicosporioides]